MNLNFAKAYHDLCIAKGTGDTKQIYKAQKAYDEIALSIKNGLVVRQEEPVLAEVFADTKPVKKKKKKKSGK